MSASYDSYENAAQLSPISRAQSLEEANRKLKEFSLQAEAARIVAEINLSTAKAALQLSRTQVDELKEALLKKDRMVSRLTRVSTQLDIPDLSSNPGEKQSSSSSKSAGQFYPKMSQLNQELSQFNQDFYPRY